MTTRLIYIVSILFLVFFSKCEAQSIDAPVSKIEAIVELPKEKPFVGEPLRLILRSAIHAQVASERINQPELTDFDWQQFGVDTFSTEFIDGFWMPVVTRVLMIYPLRAGQLTINSFRRHITYYSTDGARIETELISKPISIDVASRDFNFDQGNSWLPAKSLHVIDKWEPEPDKIHYGETAKRILTIEAEGLTADRLPNLPPFRAPGIITFARPVERQTIITDQGPIGKAVYQWNVRPVSITPASAPAITLKWFDVSKRSMQETIVPERSLAYIQNSSFKETKDFNSFSTLYTTEAATEFILSFIITGSLAFLIYSSKSLKNLGWRNSTERLRLLIILLSKAVKNQQEDFYVTIMKLAALDKSVHTSILQHKDIKQEIIKIEEAQFGFRKKHQTPKLRSLTFKLIRTIFD